MSEANNALDAAKSRLIAAQESLRLSRAQLEAAGESVNSMPEILSGLDAALANVSAAQKAVNDSMSANGGRRRRKSRKSRNSARKTRRRNQQRGGGYDVYVLYESGAPEGLKFVGVFRTLEAAKTKVEALIKTLNAKIMAEIMAERPDTESEDLGEFKMETADDGRVAFSEYRKGGFYVETVPFEEG